MKKAVICIICLLITSIFIVPCYAKDYFCPQHGNKLIYEQKGYSWYEPKDEKSHRVYVEHDYFCGLCDEYLGSESERGGLVKHTFSNGICIYCGYERKGPPSGDELQAQALRQGSTVLNQTLTILHAGNIRSEPNAAAEQIGTAHADQKFTVLDYTVVDGKYTWFKVNYDSGTAWISASLGEVDAYVDPGIDPSIYIGRTCKVTAVSARCRVDADKDAAQLTSVKKGKTFVILDAKNAKNGKPWFKISVDNFECWISSSVVEVK